MAKTLDERTEGGNAVVSTVPGSGQAHASAGFSGLDGRGKLIIMGAVLMGLFLSSLDQTIVGTALPRITTDLHGSGSYTWVVSVYLLSSTITVPIYGKLSDVFGRKPLLLIGIVIFLAGSALSGLSQSTAQLIAFRAIQGLGAGSLFPISLAIIGDLYTARERGRYQGLFGAVFGLSFIIGPFLGGFLTDNVSWRWVFYVNLPIGVAALALITAVLPNVRRSASARDLDYLGIAVFTAGVVPLMLGLNNKGQADSSGRIPSWTDPSVGGLILIALAVLAVFVLIETRAKEPIVPLQLFRDRTFAATIAATVAVSLGMFGAVIFLPRFYQTVRGVSATRSGYEIWPLLVGLIGGSILAGQLISRTGRYKAILMGSSVSLLAGMVLMTQLRADTSTWVLWFWMLVVGIGIGPAMSGYTTVIQNVVPMRFLGVATGVLTFFRQIGGSIGLAVAGTIYSQSFSSQLPASLARSGVPGPVAGRLVHSGTGNLTGVGNVGGQAATSLGGGSSSLASHITTGVHDALAMATATIFWLGVASAVVAIVAVVLIREVPLRTRMADAPAAA